MNTAVRTVVSRFPSLKVNFTDMLDKVRELWSFQSVRVFSVFVLVIIVTTALLFVLQKRESATRCQSPYSSLNQTGCPLKRYRNDDLVQCLDKLADQNNRTKDKDHWHIAFVGDSRIRQMYHTFSSMLPLYDAEVIGHIHTKEIVLHEDASIISKVLRLQVTFLWRPHPDENMAGALDTWLKLPTINIPDLLIIGNLIWSMNEGDKMYQYYVDNLRILNKLLEQLARNTTVIWWDQDSVNESGYHGVRLTGTKADVNNRRIKEYNKAAQEIFKNANLIFWTSTHELLDEYFRGCSVNPSRKDAWRYWNCPDYVHTSFLYSYLYNQQLLNYLCF